VTITILIGNGRVNVPLFLLKEEEFCSQIKTGILSFAIIRGQFNLVSVVNQQKISLSFDTFER
jgi:hypothetical protein